MHALQAAGRRGLALTVFVCLHCTHPLVVDVFRDGLQLGPAEVPLQALLAVYLWQRPPVNVARCVARGLLHGAFEVAPGWRPDQTSAQLAQPYRPSHSGRFASAHLQCAVGAHSQCADNHTHTHTHTHAHTRTRTRMPAHADTCRHTRAHLHTHKPRVSVRDSRVGTVRSHAMRQTQCGSSRTSRPQCVHAAGLRCNMLYCVASMHQRQLSKEPSCFVHAAASPSP